MREAMGAAAERWRCAVIIARTAGWMSGRGARDGTLLLELGGVLWGVESTVAR